MKKGFTLIELLVVIAIIGILATIVVVNVNSARQKAQDVAVKGSLDALRTGAEMYYDTNSSSYASFCASSDYLKASSSIGVISSAPACYASSDGYVISAALKTSGKFWCVDSKGNSMEKTANTTGAYCQ